MINTLLPTLLFFLTFVLLIAPDVAADETSVSIGNRLDTNWEADGPTRVDDWLNVYIQGNPWLVQLRLRSSQLSGEKDGVAQTVELDQRRITLHGSDLSLTAGTFYETIGRGLIFRAFEQRFVTLARSDRVFNLDRDVDGVRLKTSRSHFDLVAFAGRPRITPPNGDPTGGGSFGTDDCRLGERCDEAQAVSGDAYFLDRTISLGAAVLGTNARRIDRDVPFRETLRTARGSFQSEWSSAYLEVADLRRKETYGRGIFGELTVQKIGWGGSLEYKNYRDFFFLYQDLPTLVRTHSSVLLNTATHVQKPQGEEGVQLELVRAYSPWSVTTTNFTVAWNKELLGSNFRYREAYIEHSHEGDPLTWTVFGDWADDSFEGNNNRWTAGFAIENHIGGGEVSGIMDLEIQRVDPEELGRPNPNFTNGFAQTGVSKAGVGTFALRYQWTDREQSFPDQKVNWLSGTASAELGQGVSLFVFGGARPAGLVCSGGFCFFTPEFEGIEARLLSAF